MPDNELIPIELTNETVESLICEIRGQKVMLDYDLARIYGYETRYFNQQVKRIAEKFPDGFMFQVTYEETKSLLMSQFVTSSWGGTRKKPFAFTEQGIYMLMTILKGETATRQSIVLVKAFKQMKDYIIENSSRAYSGPCLEFRFSSIDRRFEVIEKRIDTVMDNFIDESAYRHFIILDGEKIEADVAYSEIYARAKQSIIVIDDYIDVKTLQLLRAARDGVSITVISDNRAKPIPNPHDDLFYIIFFYY